MLDIIFQENIQQRVQRLLVRTHRFRHGLLHQVPHTMPDHAPESTRLMLRQALRGQGRIRRRAQVRDRIDEGAVEIKNDQLVFHDAKIQPIFLENHLQVRKKVVPLHSTNGVLAQLVERLNGIQKVRSSILLCSTKGR